ncbi:hypothetical protein C8R46DRAFT_1218071 [Mycena filopes]|nr:hypothetical protein C8R46DRAFT_1227948 [Mycena filopes]KAJ7168679.1 hypothetical protein C8R46DRAFT_1218071 [Mycena filopes]
MTVRIIVMMHRLPHISFEQFDKHWSEIHGPLVRALPAVKSGLIKYKQFHVSPGTNDLLAAKGLAVIPHDGIIEVEADRIEDILEFWASKDVAEIIMPDEKNFVERTSLQVISGNWTQ